AVSMGTGRTARAWLHPARTTVTEAKAKRATGTGACALGASPGAPSQPGDPGCLTRGCGSPRLIPGDRQGCREPAANRTAMQGGERMPRIDYDQRPLVFERMGAKLGAGRV